ncbi:hypothetical protein ACXYMO_04480 [Arenibacterium sp. CAU 1754]
MLNKLLKLMWIFGICLFLYAIGMASIPQDDGRPSPLTILVSSLFDGLSLITSDEEILMGHRTFDGSVRFGRLSFHGTAFTFTDRDDPKTFVPYSFAFDKNRFTPVPRVNRLGKFYEKYNAGDLPIKSGVDLESCVEPRRETIATGDGLSLINPMLCRIQASLPNAPDGMIGVVFPADNETPLADGDATCRSEFAHWRTLSGYEDASIVLCAIVDRPFDPDAYRPQDWMDVIFYQQYAGKLYNMRADTRNFQRIN